MLKYSLIALTAAAVIFSAGCEDSECCGIQKDDGNVAPVITRVLGMANNSVVACEPGTSKTLNASADDTNGNLDPNTYSWTVDGQPYSANSIECPPAGQTKKVCVTVKDEKGLVSNQACITLKGQTTPVAVSCVPNITMRDASGNVVTSVTKGEEYTFDNNVTTANCPNAECTWSVRSHRKDGAGYFTCLINNSHVGTDDEPPTRDDGTYHVNLVGSGNTASIKVQTCASVYDYFEVMLNCTNPDVNKTAKYNLQ